MSTFPLSHKTVFVLDRSPYFAQSCNQPIEYDVLKSKGSGIIPAAPITKSLWTCSIEALQEYLRIVTDIYPRERQIRVVTGSSFMNPWNCPDIISTILSKLSLVGPPTKEDDGFSVLHGLSAAINSLREPTMQQLRKMESSGQPVKNRGRIILLTHLKTQSQMEKLEGYVQEEITQLNLTEAGDLLPIHECELVVVHSVPLDHEIRLHDRPLREVGPVLRCELTTSLSGRHLYNKLVSLCCRHYDLCSTTVTGIPMKEEQNASSSANYDVELLHPAAAHDDLFKSEHAEGLVIPSKEGLPIETAPLKWCTPKSSVVELHKCSSAYRICPVDVNSRPSSCLTNFLIGGRAVMLEQPRKSGVKVISHMLASHGGEIFLHSIPSSRSILEDPPSISEGCGGRVTDYRITAFGEFMKENRLAPSTSGLLKRLEGKPSYTKALDHLEKSSRFWPMVISETILFNILNNVSPLPQLMMKETLTDDETVECKRVILRVVAMETNNEALPVPAAGARGKGAKRDEQYRQLWAELDALVRSYSDTSEQHAKVLACLQECRKPPQAGTADDTAAHAQVQLNRKLPTPGVTKDAGKTEADQSWRELDRLQQMTDREKQDFLQTDKQSDAPPVKKMKSEDLLMRSGGQTLLSMWNNRLRTINSKRSHDFDGWSDTDGEGKARLYIHLEEDNTQEPVAPTPATPKK